MNEISSGVAARHRPDIHIPSTVDAVVIGAGFGGLYAHHRLRSMGLSIFGFEAAPEVGGTWFWNRYPGARCDIESLDYSYSFSAELLDEWKWTERFATQPEILRYINHVADKFDLRRDIAFDTRIIGCRYDQAGNLWTIETEHGDTVSCTYLITTTGCLSAPKPPEFEGLEDFEGRWVQTSTWPRDSVAIAGKRVAVIGTGSSGIQSIPEIAREAAHLTVFQRTPNYTIPARNAPIDPEWEATVRADYVEHHRRNRETRGGVQSKLATGLSTFEVGEAERLASFEHAWKFGSAGIQAVYSDLLSNPEANVTIAGFVQDKIREIVKDPEVAERLTPRDHPFATKRLCLDTDYYDTFNRPNVELVDIRSTPIERITARGVKTSDREYPFDLIVFATGFDAMTGPLLALNIQGVDGMLLKDAWKDGPSSYLGLMIAGFPNLFTVNGPGSPSVLANMIPTIEHHVDWIADCITYMRRHNVASIEAEPEAQTAWADTVRDVANMTLFPRAKSWYMGANVPGKPRVFLAYVGGLSTYIARCSEIVSAGYTGFRLTPEASASDEAARTASIAGSN
jgi:cation diffusion facilitator CzcD-associated flavoprotein CzcO